MTSVWKFVILDEHDLDDVLTGPGHPLRCASMLRNQLDALMADVLHDRRLLDHPFYRRWEVGTLARHELAAYAGQYRHFEKSLPAVLEAIVAHLPDGPGRQAVERNLHDERSVPAPHLELFDAFAAAVGGSTESEPAPGTAALVDLYDRLARTSPVAGLAALAAYEVQAPHIATSKADGLRSRYGIGADGTRFWEVHSDMDEHHGEWALDAIASLAGDASEVTGAARAAADAWWAFLDERDAEAPLLATA
jgi:pyrroloquinoline quinone (PQQ) biosynthesis protein C